MDFVSSPFLVRESSFKGKNGSSETLRLDLMDRTTSMYYDADILIFNTGHWWTHEKTSRGYAPLVFTSFLCSMMFLLGLIVFEMKNDL